jgi:hypothetical protein
MKLAIGLLTCCALLAGCEADRVAKLEKENADLKAKVEKQNTALDYDLQAKCSKDAVLLDFTNHYDAKLNKCFILVLESDKFSGPFSLDFA